jgi:hypothetical protein
MVPIAPSRGRAPHESCLDWLAAHAGRFDGPLRLGLIRLVRDWLDATGDFDGLIDAVAVSPSGPRGKKRGANRCLGGRRAGWPGGMARLAGARSRRVQGVARLRRDQATGDGRRETGDGYHCTCWSKTYSGCGWDRVSQSGTASTGGSSQAGGPNRRGLSFREQRNGYCRLLTALQRTLAWRALLTALGR